MKSLYIKINAYQKLIFSLFFFLFLFISFYFFFFGIQNLSWLNPPWLDPLFMLGICAEWSKHCMRYTEYGHPPYIGSVFGISLHQNTGIPERFCKSSCFGIRKKQPLCMYIYTCISIESLSLFVCVYYYVVYEHTHIGHTIIKNNIQ